MRMTSDMTPYEYGDLAQSAFGNANSTFALMLSVVSAYLIVAYTVGDKLTRMQLIVLNLLFVFTALFIAFLVTSFATTGVRLAMLANPELTRADFFTAKPWTVAAVAAINILGVCSALFFMFDKRRSAHRRRKTGTDE